MARYSKLAPLSVIEKIEITSELLSFFSVMNNKKNRDLLKLESDIRIAKPLTVINFFNYCKDVKGTDLQRREIFDNVQEFMLNANIDTSQLYDQTLYNLKMKE